MVKSISLNYPLVSDRPLSRAGWRARAVVAADVLLVVAVSFLIVVRAKEYFNVQAVLLVLAGGCVLKNFLLDESWKRAGTLNLLDLAVTLVVGVELLNYLTSTYRPNTFLYLNDVLFFFLFYWLVRFNLNREYQRTVLFVVLALCGVTLAGFSLYYSWGLYRRLQTLGFTDVTNFRNYIYFLNPIGLPIGVWSTIFFPLACFPAILLIKFRHLYLARLILARAIALILVAMAVTFIRGVYIGLFASFALLITLTLLYRLFPVRTIVRGSLVLMTLLILGLLPVLRPVMTTLSLFSTTSQVRSFKGRTKLWEDSSQMVKDHPWFGVGSGNFAMKHIAYRSTDDDAAFVLRPFNVLLQVLAEKGLVGLLAYGFLAASFLWVSHRKIRSLRHDVYKQFVVVIFVTAFIGMIVRDMSESSMLVNGGVGIMLTYMFAHNAQPECN
jgi:O-antigen ligase